MNKLEQLYKKHFSEGETFYEKKAIERLGEAIQEVLQDVIGEEWEAEAIDEDVIWGRQLERRAIIAKAKKDYNINIK